MTEASTLEQAAAQWWRTSICDIAPGRIAYRGYPIEELIGRISFPAMIWLMLRGELPTPQQENLLQAALVASVDHGPHAPSIAIAQMAVSCGLPLNGAMASAINTLDDVHGGAGEQAIELYEYVLRRSQEEEIDSAAAAAIDHFTATRSEYLPGFGHRFHPVDPRAAPLLALVDAAVADGSVEGNYAKAARAIERVMQRRKGRLIPMNIDGATAVIYGELGFAAPLARGIFCLSRAVGILSHAWEQTGRKDRNKGPMPKLFGYQYEGRQRRHLDVAP
ncbi:citrate synthase [Bradyrhizobium sp. CCBAU 45394]|uniref:citryl-CoA lyase n=1 Tax=Bradyrhizobium sp. CCBAU 45394 TaxID=1325087 RepID=UPI0023048962|nr:citryl-CoA lyase [Bradyrhizobium sp. CCBAU 45394]MDA9392472.1 citrate synthase [Bradyrhizobium sp. CCBAU 45394]